MKKLVQNNKLNQIFSFFFIALILVNLFTAPVFANNLEQTGDAQSAETIKEKLGLKVIAAPGFFSEAESTDQECSLPSKEDATKAIGKEETTEGKLGATNDDQGIGADAAEDVVAALMKSATDWILETTCEFDSSTGLGLMQQITIFAEPVNVTIVPSLMAITGIVQWLSLTLMVFGILFFSYRLMMGDMDTDPFRFAIRYLLSMFLVYYAPYFVQDVLNLNNIIINDIAENFTFDMNGITADIHNVIPMALIGFVATANDSVMGFAAILLIFVILLFCLIPIFKLIVWWYTRLIKLYIYTAISPIMFASLGVQNTSSTGFKFISNLIQEVFSQFFVILGIFVTGAFIAELPNLAETINFGLVGTGIAFYAALSFLNEVPKLASELLNGNVKDFDFGQGLARTTRGMSALGRSVTGQSVRGISKGASATDRLMQRKSPAYLAARNNKVSKGIGGAMGAVGRTAGKVGGYASEKANKYVGSTRVGRQIKPGSGPTYMSNRLSGNKPSGTSGNSAGGNGGAAKPRNATIAKTVKTNSGNATIKSGNVNSLKGKNLNLKKNINPKNKGKG